jgi:hypothetical protein
VDGEAGSTTLWVDLIAETSTWILTQTGLRYKLVYIMEHIDTLSLSQIQELTGNYSDRQGLRVIPMALAVMVQAFPRWYPAKILGVDSMLVALAAGFVGYWLIGLYYRRRFGSVEELPYEGTPLATQLGIVFIAFIVSITIDLALHPRVFLSGLVIAAWLAIAAWPSRRLRREYSSIAFVLALLSLAPLAGVPLAAVGRGYGFSFGVMLLIAGLRDHFAFVSVFPPMERQHE